MRVSCVQKVKAEMRRWLASATLGALTMAAIWGSAMAVRQLRRAVSESQDLYRLDLVGSQIEGDLEFQTQQNRFASVDPARRADENVRAAIGRLRRLQPSGAVNQSIQDFETSWSAYAQTHGKDAFLTALG